MPIVFIFSSALWQVCAYVDITNKATSYCVATEISNCELLADIEIKGLKEEFQHTMCITVLLKEHLSPIIEC